MFRRERPQKGRYRQFYQINAEIFGVASPLADVELIFLLKTLCERLSAGDVEAHINSLGCPECRPVFKTALQEYIASCTEALCSDCARRKDRNPLRVLDCKVPGCREAMQKAPSIIDHLCPACTQHFNTVQASLASLEVPFIVDKRLVRGLDYYTRTTFEIQTRSLGAQSAVAGGGRYDGLVKMLGGPDMPATGFAIGFDRLAEVVDLDKQAYIKKPDLYIAALDEKSGAMAFEWLCALGIDGIQTSMDFEGRSLKSQMKRAGRCGARYTLIVGEDERATGQAILRNMTTREQVSVPLAELVKNIKPLIKK